MCGADGHCSTTSTTANVPLNFPEHLYEHLTDAHCHIQDDRANIHRLVQSWSSLDSNSNSNSGRSNNNNNATLLTKKVCLMGVQPSKNLGDASIELSQRNQNQDESILISQTDSLSLNESLSPSSSSTPIITVTWNETDTKGDWDLVSKLAHNHPDRFVPCFGIHPWFTHKYRPLEGPSGNNIELRGVPTAATTTSGSGGTSTSPSLSFSSSAVTSVPNSNVSREAFLAMSKQLQDHMIKENLEKQNNQETAPTIQDSTTSSTDTKKNESIEQASSSPSSQQHNSTYLHYQKVLSLPNSAPENYLEELTQRLPEPRALEPALKELRRLLEEHPHAVLGEIGLDRTARVPEPINTRETEQKKTTLALTSIQHQLDLVREQLKLAASLSRPVSFHCVQAYGHWHDFLIHEGKRLKQWEIDQGYYQTQIQKIHASGGTATISPISPSGVRLSKKSTARLQREARDAAWERHVASTLQESSDEEDEDEDDNEDEEEDEAKRSKTESNKLLDATNNNEGDSPGPMTTVVPIFEAVLPPRLCMHSYGGSVNMMKAFVKMDHPPEIFFSFSILINGRLQDRKLKELILAVPEDRLLIESDHHSHVQVDNLLVEMVHKIAEIRQWTIEDTVNKTARNWNRFVYG
ncbi:hypothetical protein BGZ46_010811 [Entomortierella lignicola]|nr:hypothetical protein BGZ46_010811 [Entomortierella lignicola]